jgi:cell division protein FtsI (penicillin-binding protein 3)
MRAYLTGAVVTLGLAGVAVRAWALQIDDGDRYRALADRQHEMTLAIPAPRGEVVDAHGSPLAVSADVDSIWANPHEVRDVAATAERLAKLTDGDEVVLEAKLGGDHKFVWIDRHVSAEVARAVQAAKLPGIEVVKEPRRWYPARSIAGPVIGRADIDGNGLDGIELAMNDLLAGKRGHVSALRDARGRTMLADGVATLEPGASVHLSLDRSIQAIAEAALADGVAANKAKFGVAVVLDVATSRVLALASSPTYDPNSGATNGARNRPVVDAYEAGSVMKVFSVASALDAGVVKPETEFQIGNALVVGKRAIHDTHFFPYLTVSGIIKHSSNIGAAKIALQLGSEKLYAGYKAFGLGTKTGIELPGEQVGMLRGNWRDIDLAHVAFGYGLTVTPLQIAAAMAAIGNHGMYVEPRIVDEVLDGDGTVLYRGTGEVHRAISDRTADAMKAMLASVFDSGKDGGTAHNVVVPGFSCGGKTGTAYKYDPATHQYATNRYMASFAGLAPIDNPRLAIVVMVDEPSAGVHYGGEVSAPVFAIIASESLRYLGVPGAALPPPPPAPAVAKKPTAPPPPEPPPAVDPVIAAVTVPDFAGMGVGRALDVARSLDIAVDVIGSGRVVAQDPPPGPADTLTHVTLHFSDDARGF